MSTIRRTAARAVALAAGVGCLVPVPAAQAAPTATTTVSAALAGTVVSTADIDGDGRRDRTTLEGRGTRGDGLAIIRVQTATGRTMRATTRLGYVEPTRSFHAAAAIDGVRGKEIVVQTDMGAHTPWYRVLTVRDGRLVTLVDPEGQSRWTVDSALWIGKGYTRTVTSTGSVRMTSHVALRDGAAQPFTLTTRTVRWSNGRWAPVSVRKAKVSAANAYRLADWHVAGVPRAYA